MKFEDKLKYWQHRLMLDNWHIVLRDNCPLSDFILKEVQGETEWDTVNRCAVVKIISKNEYGNRIIPFDKEKVLIHELLHIKFSLLWESNSDTQNLILHQIIEDIANSLKGEEV